MAVRYIHLPHAFGEPATARLNNGANQTIPAYADVPETITIAAKAGQMNIVPAPLTDLSAGRAITRLDGSTTLDLVDLPSDVTTITAKSGGKAVVIEAKPKRMLRGWGDGRHYMLAVDPTTKRLDIEPGRNHRKLYVTGGAHGYTVAMIAAETGLAQSAITNTWIAASTVYGRSQAKALHKTVGLPIWGDITIFGAGGPNPWNSFWLMLERGYDYSDVSFGNNKGFLSRSACGESPLHPQIVTDYGTGTAPIAGLYAVHSNTQNATWIAFQGVDITNGSSVISPLDIILSHVNFRGKGLDVQGGGHGTLYRVGIFDSSKDAPSNGVDWVPLGNHKAGIYASGLTSLLVLDWYMDHNGWRDGYSQTSLAAVDGPHPPSMYSHNFYLQYDFGNITIRRGITSRAASQGIQARPGALIEDVFYLDNNMNGNALGRSKVGTTSDVANAGNYSLFHANITTSAGYRRHQLGAAMIGEYAKGVDLGGFDGAMIDSIWMHMSDPDNAAEVAAKSQTNVAYQMINPTDHGYAMSPRIHRWDSRQNNAAQYGISEAALNALTIQKFATGQRGSPTTIPQYCEWLKTQSPAVWMTQLEAAQQYFRTPWGLHVPRRVNATLCRFEPDARCSGRLWADRLNWTSDDVAGSVNGDDVDLRGHQVLFGEVTVNLGTLTGGAGAKLEVNSGKLTAASVTDVEEIRTSLSGQIWIGDATGVEDFIAESGRIGITGAASGHNMTVSGQFPEVLLGANHTIVSGKVMDICCGAQGAVGWDGTGTASLTIANGGTLRLRAYAGAYGARMSKLERFKYRGDRPDPTVAVTVTLAAGSAVEVVTTGLTLTAGQVIDLTGPGVTVVNNGATLGANVSVSGSKLIYTVPA